METQPERRPLDECQQLDACDRAERIGRHRCFWLLGQNPTHAWRDTELDAVLFKAAANAFTIHVRGPATLAISGTGIANNSGIEQNFLLGGDQFSTPGIVFTNKATAGVKVVFTLRGVAVDETGGFIQFLNSSTGGSSTFINNGSAASSSRSTTDFFDTSSADSGTYINNGGTVSGAKGGATEFFDTATAGTARISNFGSGYTWFFGGSTAADAVITNAGRTAGANLRDGGLLVFDDTSTAGRAQISNRAYGDVDFLGNASAGSSTIISAGGITALVVGEPHRGGAAEVEFDNSTTAGAATITLLGGTVNGAVGARLLFTGFSTAEAATITAGSGSGGGLGGQILFERNSDGGSARAILEAGGALDITGSNRFLTALGSIEGAGGTVLLGNRGLIVGGNDRSTEFAGVIEDSNAHVPPGTFPAVRCEKPARAR